MHNLDKNINLFGKWLVYAADQIGLGVVWSLLQMSLKAVRIMWFKPVLLFLLVTVTSKFKIYETFIFPH